MRLFAFILSLFILVLSIVPCSDDEDCKEGIELTADHSGHDHEEDSCTPFCACSCCGCAALILSAPVIHVTLKEVEVFTSTATSYHSDFTSNYFYSIWQPPKLS
jgi:hypothetical protein